MGSFCYISFMQITHTVIKTQEEALQALQSINYYLDTLEAEDKKLRLAVDTETCLTKEERDWYDLQYSLKKQKKKDKEAGVLHMLQAPEYPIPHPRVGKSGHIKGMVRLLQIGLDPEICNVQFVFDLFLIYMDWKKNVYESNAVDIWTFYKDFGALIGPLFSKATLVPRASALGMFLTYEYEFFWKLMGFHLEETRDLFLMSKILYNGDMYYRSHDLATIYKREIPEEVMVAHTGMTASEYAKFKKEEQKSPWWAPELTDDQYLYAAQDVGPLVWYAFDVLYRKLEEWGAEHDSGEPNTGVLQAVVDECALQGVIAVAENTGVPFCKETYLKEVKPNIDQKMEEAQAHINELSMRRKTVMKKTTVGRGKNKQVFFEEVEEVTPHKVGYYKDIREITGLSEEELESTGADDLFFFRDHHPSIPWICQYKKYQKLKGYFESTSEKSYLSSLDAHGFIHPSIHQIGTDSSRMSQTSPNLTQVPRDKPTRGCFKAPRGKKLLIKDFGQFEPRVTARKTLDPFYMETFLSGKDMHWETTKFMYGVDGEFDKKNPEQVELRFNCKTIRLAKTYMMGLTKFMRSLFIDSEGALDFILRGAEGEKEARALSTKFDSLSPAVTEYVKKVEEQVRFLPQKYKGLHKFTGSTPFYVGKGDRGHTRRFCLTQGEKANAKGDPETWTLNHKLWDTRYERESSYINKCNTKLRDTTREAFNNEIQCTQAEAFKVGILYFWRRLRKMEAENVIKLTDCVMINFIHDEVIALVNEDIAQMMEPIMEEELLAGAKEVLGDIVPLVVDGGIMDSWAEKA